MSTLVKDSTKYRTKVTSKRTKDWVQHKNLCLRDSFFKWIINLLIKRVNKVSRSFLYEIDTKRLRTTRNNNNKSTQNSKENNEGPIEKQKPNSLNNLKY
jgi:hypothetical protein